jgi:hypothetical protein
MKKSIAIALIFAAGALTSMSASAERSNHVQLLEVGYGMPPTAMMCTVNGVAYPVDYNNVIWGSNAYGNWVVLGRIQNYGYGPVAVTPYGNYGAYCVPA